MKRLVPPSRTGHDPLEGREWRGYTCSDELWLDNQRFHFYRYNRHYHTVEISEAHTGILWQVDEGYFMDNTRPVVKESVLFYTVDKNEHGRRTIRTRRQNARYQYMSTVRDHYRTVPAAGIPPNELTHLADIWWPGTIPTVHETRGT